ncbi:MAG: hypothetical protein EAZ99_06205 [Alphaproteobacteria bacterium]|nr:hypothetical protein [Alphaproteobacteria bacterium]TAD90433.1 MAG: hypothetical protein EAZ99_06205 [Alphaproteobacteria bacterium]
MQTHLLAAVTALCLAAPLVEASAQQRPAGSESVEVTVRNMEAAINRLNQMRDNPKAAQAALVLQLLRGAGRPGPAENGRSRLDYRIDVAPDGRVLVNDVDVNALIDTINRMQRR